MLRGVIVDLRAAVRARDELPGIYARDLEAEVISDDVIERVGVIVRNCNAALDKTANGVRTKFYSRSSNTYFPIAATEAEFESRLDRSVKGLRADHPEIADAFKRHQPFQPLAFALQYLKPLYREFAHHDFSYQRRNETEGVTTLSVGGFNLMSISDGKMTMGGSSWRGFPIKDGKVWSTADPSGPGLAEGTFVFAEGTFVDWHFVEPDVSVIDTLRALIDACGEACHDVSLVAQLGTLDPQQNDD